MLGHVIESRAILAVLLAVYESEWARECVYMIFVCCFRFATYAINAFFSSSSSSVFVGHTLL